MGWFGRRKKEPVSRESRTRPLTGRQAFCRICKSQQQFSRCWLRVDPLSVCPCCGLEFVDAPALYQQRQPACPSCGEFLEQPSFEYGLCDGCGSRFELMQGTRPGLLPNQKQRAEMDTHGKVWKP